MSGDAEVARRLGEDIVDERLHALDDRWKQRVLMGIFLLCREKRWYYVSLLCLSALAELGPASLQAVFGSDLEKFVQRSLVLNHRINDALALMVYSREGKPFDTSESEPDVPLEIRAAALLGVPRRYPARRWNLPGTDRWYDAATLMSELNTVRRASSRIGAPKRGAWAFHKIRQRLGLMDARLKDGALMRLQRHAGALSELRWKRLATPSSSDVVHLRIHYSTAILTVSSLYRGERRKMRRFYPQSLIAKLSDEARQAIDSHFGPRMLALKAYELMRCLHRPGVYPGADVLLAEFYDLLLKDILASTDLASGARPTLVVCTHGVLTQIPFAALFDGTHYLVERFDVVQAAILQDESNGESDVDASALTGGDSIRRRALRVLVNPRLEQATLERSYYRSLDAPVYDLSETRRWDQELFARLLSEEGIAILSTHTQPGSSGAARTLLQSSDGTLLPFSEVLSVPIRADLFVLASCSSTASVDWFSDDEANLVSLCLTKGAKSVVATLWPINDVVGRLYNEALMCGLLAGKSRSRAHADAQRRLMQANVTLAQAYYAERLVVQGRQPGANMTAPKGTRLDHPHYWAPFILSGAWR